MKKNILHKILHHSKADKIVSRLIKKPYAVILAYHQIGPIPPEQELLREHIVEPEDFESQIRHLKENFQVVSLAALLGMLSSGKLEKMTASVTFDDGYLNNYTNAYPVLRKHQVPATIFIPTDFIETKKSFYWEIFSELLNQNFDNPELVKKIRNLFSEKDHKKREGFIKQLQKDHNIMITQRASSLCSWRQFNEMKEGGVQFGSHGATHRVFSLLSKAEVSEEIRKSKEILDRNLTQDTRLFAYPYGELKDQSSIAVDVLKQNGFECALTMEQGVVYPGDDVFSLKRVGIGGFDDMEIFAQKINGVIPAMNRFKKRILCK